MLRPYKDIKEFKVKTGFSIGSVIGIRYKRYTERMYTGILIGLDFYTNSITIGDYTYGLDQLYEDREYYKDNEWKAFGVEDTSVKEPLVKPAKFKVGKKYRYISDCNKSFTVIINTKYKDPVDNKLKVVINGTSFSTVYTDKEGNEKATFLNVEICAKTELLDD